MCSRSDDLREGIKAFSNWPTIPQLYVKGEFVGGCDIIREMFQAGELQIAAQGQGRGGQDHGLTLTFRFPLLTACARGGRMASTNRTAWEKAMPWKTLVLALASLGFVTAAQARIVEIRIDAVEPFIDGHSFGSAGPYERVKGIAKGELDPERAGECRHRRSRQGAAERSRLGRIRGRHFHPAAGRPGEGLRHPLLRGASTAEQAARHAAPRCHFGRRGLARQRAQQSDHARACRHRLRVRARLYGGVVGLGPRRVEREWRA